MDLASHGHILFFFLQIQFLRFFYSDSLEPDLMIRLSLHQLRNIHTGYRSDLGISAGGLAVSQQNNRLSMRRNLNGTKGYTIGNDIRAILRCNKRAFQASAHTVKIAGHRICLAEQCMDSLFGKHVILRSHNHPQSNLFLIKLIEIKLAG